MEAGPDLEAIALEEKKPQGVGINMVEIKGMPPRAGVVEVLKNLRDITEERLKDPEFLPSEEEKENLDRAHSYGELTNKSIEVTRETSAAHRASLAVLGQEGQKEAKALLEAHTVVRIGEDGEVRTLAEWKDYLDTLSPEDRAKAEEVGMYAFRFSTENNPDQNKPENEHPSKPYKDQQVNRWNQEGARLAKEGKNMVPKEVATALVDVLHRHPELLKPEYLDMFDLAVLEHAGIWYARQGSVPEGFEQVLKQARAEVTPEMRQNLANDIRESGIDDPAFQTLQQLLEVGEFNVSAFTEAFGRAFEGKNPEQFRQIFFKEKITQEQAEKLIEEAVGKEQAEQLKKSDGWAGILLFLALAVVGVGAGAVKVANERAPLTGS